MSSFSIKILEASGRKGVERDVKRTEKLVGLRKKSCPSPYHRLSWCRRDRVGGSGGGDDGVGSDRKLGNKEPHISFSLKWSPESHKTPCSLS